MTRKTMLVVVASLLTGAVIGFAASSLLHSLLEHGVQSKAKRSIADCASISAALEAYHKDKGAYPPLQGDTQALAPYLTPTYIRSLPSIDAFAQPYVVCMRGEKAAVIAPGKYGAIVEGGALVSSAGWDPPLQTAPN